MKSRDVVRPGDSVLLAVDSIDTSESAMATMTKNFMEKMPGVKIIVHGGARENLIYRPRKHWWKRAQR